MKQPSIEIDGKFHKVLSINWYGLQENSLIDTIAYEDDNKYNNSSIFHHDSDEPLSKLLVWDEQK